MTRKRLELFYIYSKKMIMKLNISTVIAMPFIAFYKQRQSHKTHQSFSVVLFGKHTAWHWNLHSTVQNREKSAFQRELLSERKTNDFINGRYYRILDLSQGLSDYDH